ncbi:hypothetical protein MVEG_08919 [Podila verticillata NRRL 6337]|nr:MAG: hypothetical protein BYD32DRAFT_473964 [Podila humilis]KFH65441.1 hypothetical protein MVEG_08919 [Podila verticillata NRRL 6337]
MLKILSNLSLEQLLPCQTVSRRFRMLSRIALIDKLTNTNPPIPSSSSRVCQDQMSRAVHNHAYHLQESAVGRELVLVLFPDNFCTPRHWEECQSVRFVCIGADRETEWLVFTPVGEPCLRIHLVSGQTSAASPFSGVGSTPMSDLYHAPAIGLDIFDYASGKRRFNNPRRDTGYMSDLGSYSRPLGTSISVEPSLMPKRSRRDQDRYGVIGIRHGSWPDEQGWGGVDGRIQSMMSLPWPYSREPSSLWGSPIKGSEMGPTHGHRLQTWHMTTRPYYAYLCLHYGQHQGQQQQQQQQHMVRDDIVKHNHPLCDTSQCSLNPFSSSVGSTHISMTYEASLADSEGCEYCRSTPCRSRQEIQVQWRQVRVSLDWVLAGLHAPSPKTARTRTRTPEKDARR